MEMEKHDKFRVEDYLPFLDPDIAKWFNSRYSSLTEPQKRAIPLIHQKKNVLVSSPTGTGKTLTGFLSIINELFLMARAGTLEDKIYCVYISPLKALANDIDKNLKRPLDEIYQIAEESGERVPRINVAVRSGDTPQNERQRMLRKPPHIFITTPESLSLALSAPKFKEKLITARYLVLDEIHEVSATKRGALLSLNVERLEAMTGGLVRIGLSATQAPLEVIGSYLCGYNGNVPRKFEIVDVDTKKFLDLQTMTPVRDLTQASSEVANDRMYDILAELIDSHQTTLVFTNTRAATEHVAIRLKARGIESIEAHHSSLGKETRLEVENKLKNGELKCVITSTSLELGIDIGYIDLVVQIGSPKSVSKGLQRIGRSGHGINELSKGRFVVFDLDDLVECSVLTKAAYDREIDRVVVPRNSLDVLAQALVGMSLEKQWKKEEALAMVRNSYTFHNLPEEDFEATLNYLSGEMESGGIFPKLWYDRDTNTFGRKKSSRMIYFMNIGTIPDESDYHVVNERGKHLGQLSDKFVERLKTGDILVLGARTYMFLRTSRNKVTVKEATGMRPTVPSWTGEMLPRSYDLGVLIGKFREEAVTRITGGDDVAAWLSENYRLDQFGVNSIISYIRSQMKYAIPSHKELLVEGYVDESSNYNAIFHIPLGRRVNDALSRAYAQELSDTYSVNTRITVTDDGFMLTYPKKISLKSIVRLVNEKNIDDLVRKSIHNTEIFKQRFRHCASRSLMILRKYKGYDISVAKQQLRSDRVLKSLETIPNFPVIKETFNEILNDMMDLPRAKAYVSDVVDGSHYRCLEYSAETSPFSHGIILAGISDVVLMEDRSKLLRELQSKIIDKVYGTASVRFLIQDQKLVDAYFRSKVPRIEQPDDIRRFASHFLYIDPFRSRFNSPGPYSTIEISGEMEERILAGDLRSVYVRGTQYANREHAGICQALFARSHALEPAEEKVYNSLDDSTLQQIKSATGTDDLELKNALIKLESSYLIQKVVKNGITRYRKDIKSDGVDMKKALREALTMTLGSFGPMTLDEILIKVPVDEELLTRELRDLTSSGILVMDYITPVFSTQYMLKSDLEALLNQRKVDVRRIRLGKFLRTFDSVESFIDSLGFFSEPWDLRQRVPGYTEAEISRLVSNGKILRCRLIKRRDSYVKTEIAAALHDLRYEDPKDEEKQILNLIGNGVHSQKELMELAGLDTRTFRQLISLMEYKGSIRRIGPNNYDLLFPDRQPGDRETALRTILSVFGPLSSREISSNFWFDPAGILRTGNVNQIYSDGEIFYGELGDTSKDAMTMLLTMRDPTGAYFEGQYYGSTGLNARLIGNDGDLGDFSMEINDELAVISNVEVKTDLRNFLDGVESSLIRGGVRAAFVEAEESVMKSAGELGYNVISGKIFIGRIPAMEFSEEDFLRLSLRRIRSISESRSSHYNFIRERFLGIRNDFEANMLGIKDTLIDSFFRSRLIYQYNGPFDAPSYGAMDGISLLRSIRDYRLGPSDKEIIRLLLEEGSISEKEVILRLKKGVTGVRMILKNLYRNNVIVKDSGRKYIYVPEKHARDEALALVLREIVSLFGFFDLDRLRKMLGIEPDESLKAAIAGMIESGVIKEAVAPGMAGVVYVNSGMATGKPHPGKEGSYIIAPKDLVSLYFQGYVKTIAGTANHYLFYAEGSVKAVFTARKTGRILTVGKILGDRSYRESIKRELNSIGYAVNFA